MLKEDLDYVLSFGRLDEFLTYHFLMDDIGDIDPSYPMLRYICNRFELNGEQRYWLAFLFATCYCAPTVYYIYNEFPDYENVDVGRLQRWWGANKDKCVFQSDRLWIRSRDQFVPMFESYREHVGAGTQRAKYDQLAASTPRKTYRNAYDHFIGVKYFGRFSMFLYLESVYVVTGFPMRPDGMDWPNAQSSRNGLLYAIGWDQYLRGHGHGDQPLDKEVYKELDEEYEDLLDLMQLVRPDARIDDWNVETTLCAFKKWKLWGSIENGKAHFRYPGYYLDRQANEIEKLQVQVADGVDWGVLWDFRKETYDLEHLSEYGANNVENSKFWMEERLSRLKEEGKL